MKKIISAVLVMVLGFSAFAKIMIQGDTGFGGVSFVSHTFTDPDTQKQIDDFNVSPVLFNTIGTDIMWEFNSNEDTKFRPFVGGTIGLADWGFPIALIGGFNYSLVDIGPLSLELMTSLKTGPLLELYGYLDFYLQPSIDAIFCNSNRTGIYGGAGITGQITVSNTTFFGKEKKFTGTGLAAGHLVVGVRF